MADQKDSPNYHPSTSHKTIGPQEGSQEEDSLEEEDSLAEEYQEAEEDTQEEAHQEEDIPQAGDPHPFKYPNLKQEN